ncbi:hypothetical protein [Herbiconiux sp. VKM Ac-2851]|uniref:hypothetical protein n=1 Tax=Herbiconiux sp. VKM Ac-2851 TaxID=2739025 RepID=UPI00156410BE|nr:hypothetical protein [Herbiconiux sp. VKM Ac-2851]NQX35545.1 hypothetical protein [Herbiconiux sp. VKM Ac-2851]
MSSVRRSKGTLRNIASVLMALGAGCLLLSFRSLLRDQGKELIFLIAGLILISVGAALFLFAPYKQEKASTQDSSGEV